MNQETNERVLRLLGWREKGRRWSKPNGREHHLSGAPQAHTDPETVLAALDWMGTHCRQWRFDPSELHWVPKSRSADHMAFGSTGTTQAEAIIAGLVAWCDANGWPDTITTNQTE